MIVIKKRTFDLTPTLVQTLLGLLIMLIIYGCRNDTETGTDLRQQEGLIDATGITVEGAWMRPGQAGRMSAGYFLLTNFEDQPDTVKTVSSGASQLTEIHQSYEREDGIMGMREIDELVLPPRSTVRFEPGGLHVMFIQLTEMLEEGDEVEVTLHFSNFGEKTIRLPVRQ